MYANFEAFNSKKVQEHTSGRSSSITNPKVKTSRMGLMQQAVSIMLYLENALCA